MPEQENHFRADALRSGCAGKRRGDHCNCGSPTRSVVLFIWFLAHHRIDSVWLLELANLTDLGEGGVITGEDEWSSRGLIRGQLRNEDPARERIFEGQWKIRMHARL
jgi:hypothetical protein